MNRSQYLIDIANISAVVFPENFIHNQSNWWGGLRYSSLSHHQHEKYNWSYFNHINVDLTNKILLLGEKYQFNNNNTNSCYKNNDNSF